MKNQILALTLGGITMANFSFAMGLLEHHLLSGLCALCAVACVTCIYSLAKE